GPRALRLHGKHLPQPGRPGHLRGGAAARGIGRRGRGRLRGNPRPLPRRRSARPAGAGERARPRNRHLRPARPPPRARRLPRVRLRPHDGRGELPQGLRALPGERRRATLPGLRARRAGAGGPRPVLRRPGRLRARPRPRDRGVRRAHLGHPGPAPRRPWL
ncbi:MAG: Low molecular weight protein tyrosine phosphatase, partial [uncultured Rubrobacteraceae bacterium]